MEKNIMYLGENGIEVLVRSIIQNLFESPNYANLQESLSSLRDDINKISMASNEIAECTGKATGNGGYQFNYPAGYDATNCIVVGNRGVSSRSYRMEVVNFKNIFMSSGIISAVVDTSQVNMTYSDLKLYLMKVNPIKFN